MSREQAGVCGEGSQKAPRVQWSEPLDVILLRQVISTNPDGQDGAMLAAWEAVAVSLNQLGEFKGFILLTGKVCRARANGILSMYKAANNMELSESGTEQDVTEWKT